MENLINVPPQGQGNIDATVKGIQHLKCAGYKCQAYLFIIFYVFQCRLKLSGTGHSSNRQTETKREAELLTQCRLS